METCTQRKRYCSGEEVTAACELVTLQDRFGTLEYVVDQHLQFQGLAVSPGSISDASF